MAKPEMDFHDTELIPWEELTKEPEQYVKILAKCPKTGAFTRLIRSQPDLYETITRYDNPPGKLLVHEDYWEEVYSFSGTLIDTTLNRTFKEGYFACRPPGMKHGPFFHPTSAVSYEVRTPDKLMDKPEIEFFDTNLLPWKSVEGVEGQYEKILDRDKKNKGFTRLVLNEPDMECCVRDIRFPREKAYIYDEYLWTEIMVLDGTILDVEENATYIKGYYANFAPGKKHGPYFFPLGAMWIETRYPELVL